MDNTTNSKDENINYNINEPLAILEIADSKFYGFCTTITPSDVTSTTSTLKSPKGISLKIIKDYAINFQESLENKYQDAAHIPIVYYVPTSKREPFRLDEDGEPSNSVGPPIVDELKKIIDNNNEKGEQYFTKGTVIIIAIVRFFGGEKLLGVTCGRLSQCYASITRLTLHRFIHGKTCPLHQDLTSEQIKDININNNNNHNHNHHHHHGDNNNNNENNNNIYGMGAGDCELIYNVINDPEKKLTQQIYNELDFNGFKGASNEELPRLQHLQADVIESNFTIDNETGEPTGHTNISIPIYRYPGNYTGIEWKTYNWNSLCLQIKLQVEEILDISLYNHQKINHCVTNYYRNNNDYIAHHSDKDLDLNKNGVIISISFGYIPRILELKRKIKPYDTTQIYLPHGSMLILGPNTNKQFTHSILPGNANNNNNNNFNNNDNQIYDQPRLSLTLRDVKTYMCIGGTCGNRLYGQGVSYPPKWMTSFTTSSSNKNNTGTTTKTITLSNVKNCLLIETFIFTTIYGIIIGILIMNKVLLPFSFLLPHPTSKLLSFHNIIFFIILIMTYLLTLHYFQIYMNKFITYYEEKMARKFFSKTSISGTKY